MALEMAGAKDGAGIVASIGAFFTGGSPKSGSHLSGKRNVFSDLYLSQLIPAALLVIVGIVTIYSASLSISDANFPKHLIGIALGIIVATVVWRYDYRALANMDIRIAYHESTTSTVEGALSKMGRAGFELVRTAWRLGCRFDAWTSEFRYDLWARAATEVGIDLADVATEPFSLDARLPWDHTSPGVSKDFLRREWRRAVDCVTTPDCTRSTCVGCGVCPALGVSNVIAGERV